MNPLAIIGSVAGVAGVAAIAFLGQQMFFGFVDMIEARTEARIETALMVQAAEAKEKAEAKADEEEQNDLAQRVEWDIERQALEKQNEELFADAEQRIRDDVESFDDDTMRLIARIMCQTENIGDNRARQACVIRARQADFTNSGAILSITPKRIDDWNAKCEETGEDLYCDYAIPAITTEGLRDIGDWMIASDAAMLVFNSNQDIYARQIADLLETPEPTVERRKD